MECRSFNLRSDPGEIPFSGEPGGDVMARGEITGLGLLHVAPEREILDSNVKSSTRTSQLSCADAQSHTAILSLQWELGIVLPYLHTIPWFHDPRLNLGTSRASANFTSVASYCTRTQCQHLGRIHTGYLLQNTSSTGLYSILRALLTPSVAPPHHEAGFLRPTTIFDSGLHLAAECDITLLMVEYNNFYPLSAMTLMPESHCS